MDGRQAISPVMLHAGEFVQIMHYPETVNDELVSENVEAAADRIICELETVCGVSVTVGISSIGGGLHELNGLYLEKDMIPIRQEIECISAYCNIQKYRMRDRLQVTYNISGEIAEYITPKLILQSLVENSIEHGPGEERRRVDIKISGYLEEGRVVLEIADNGVGMTDEMVRDILSGAVESGRKEADMA